MSDVLKLAEGQVLTREDLDMVRRFILATRAEGRREAFEASACWHDERERLCNHDAGHSASEDRAFRLRKEERLHWEAAAAFRDLAQEGREDV